MTTQPVRYRHVDADGDALRVSPTALGNGDRGAFFQTDADGCNVPVSVLPELIAMLQAIAAP